MLQEAYDTGLLAIPATLRDDSEWEFPEIPPSYIEALEKENQTPQRVDRITDQFDEPARDTRRILYQDVGYSYLTRNLPGSAITIGKAYEIGRFLVSPDEFGCVKYIGTYVGIEDPPNTFPQLSPFDPYALEHNGVNGYWFLRLYQGTFQPMHAPDVGQSIINVAGYPFPELPYWRDYRFQWGRTANETFLLIPSNHALRLYFVPTSDDDLIIKEFLGRMVGFTQPIDTTPAAKNAIYAW